MTAFIKMGLLAAAAAAAASTGGLAYLASSALFRDSSVPLVVMSIVAWLTLAASVYVILGITAKLFERFDPGLHAPA